MALAEAPRTNNPSGRPSNAVLQDRLARSRQVNAILRDENRALLAEVASLGRRLIASGTTLELGYNADRPDVVGFVRAEIDRLGRACLRKAGAS